MQSPYDSILPGYTICCCYIVNLSIPDLRMRGGDVAFLTSFTSHSCLRERANVTHMINSINERRSVMSSCTAHTNICCDTEQVSVTEHHSKISFYSKVSFLCTACLPALPATLIIECPLRIEACISTACAMHICSHIQHQSYLLPAFASRAIVT